MWKTAEARFPIVCMVNTSLTLALYDVCVGDKAPDGSLRTPGPGRWTESTAPDGHNVNQYFFSPTPAYGELYAKQK